MSLACINGCWSHIYSTMKTFYEMIELLREDEGLASQDAPQPEPVASQDAPQPEALPAPEQAPQEELKHYMFFSNLKVIKNNVEQLLGMDSKELDAMLADGHDWAADHIATSKDDIEEVYNWVIGRV